MTSTEMPPLRHYKSADRIYIQAQQIWVILIAFVMQHPQRKAGLAPTITYGDLAMRMGHEDRRVGHTLSRQLGIVGDFCKHHELPVLNSIVVNQATGLPGSELTLGYPDDGDVDAETALKRTRAEHRDVMNYNWFMIRVPTTGTFRTVWEMQN